MARFKPYPYTSVSNGSTFGLLHPRKISSIVSISASTLVPEIRDSAEVDNSRRFLGRLGSFEAIISEHASVAMYEFFSLLFRPRRLAHDLKTREN